MRNIVITTFVTFLMVGTAIIGSGHVVLAHNDKYTRDFTNSGNNQEIQQDCGNSCTQTSSNTVSSGSSGLTTPSPSPSPTPTTLTLSVSVIPPSPGNPVPGVDLSGSLTTTAGSPVAGATITFTGTMPGVNQTIGLPPATTLDDGSYDVTFVPAAVAPGDQVTAHYAGGPGTPERTEIIPATPGTAASDSPSQFVP